MVISLTSLLMSVLERAKLVRDVCKRVHRIAAMRTSAAAAKTFMQIDRACESRRRIKSHPTHYDDTSTPTRSAVRSMKVFSEKLTRRQYQHGWKYRERGAHARIVYATETPNSAATNNAYGGGQCMHRSRSENTYDRDEEIQPLLAEPVNTQGKETA